MPQSQSRLVYVCSHCGALIAIPAWVDALDIYTTLLCGKCGKGTAYSNGICFNLYGSDVDTARYEAGVMRYGPHTIIKTLDWKMLERAANVCEDAGWPANEDAIALRALAARVREIQEQGEHRR